LLNLDVFETALSLDLVRNMTKTARDVIGLGKRLRWVKFDAVSGEAEDF
jgi:hypothetical protein